MVITLTALTGSWGGSALEHAARAAAAMSAAAIVRREAGLKDVSGMAGSARKGGLKDGQNSEKCRY
jgi:hypothetical protein